MAVPFAISATLGPLLLGAILNAMLYGVSAIQCFMYYRRFKRDPTWIRYFVLYLFIMESINTIFDIGLVFEPLVLNFGDPVAYTRTPAMIIPDAVVTVLLSTPVQYFIAWRIKIVSRSWIMPSIIIFFGTCSFIGGVAVSVSAAIIRERIKLARVEPALIVWLASSATADVIITASLTWSLRKRRTGHKATDEQVARIILLTIQTGALTSLFALTDFFLFVFLPQTNINFVFDLPLSKLYTNSLLSTLNARSSVLSDSVLNEDANNLFGKLHDGSPEASRRKTVTWNASRSALSRDDDRGTRVEAIALQDRELNFDDSTMKPTDLGYGFGNQNATSV
ncbi:hypothetical protein D9613_003522 [Agrocybe pediades]|uniref:DUF6534 domain-containing protein n=1 Tax=Agrocybe pediades TaxID=84607 RepID=A0A8H4VND9_9AGAR|nr:hypothetical protein D9613_003522 [Agrocybe pediades]KAF9554258.1 hypothetical protein CPC08DRAFT_713048 [Agrocybe pediades]